MIVVVDATSAPTLYEAFYMIECDNGAHLIGTVYPGPVTDLSKFEVPEPWTEKVLAAESALNLLRLRKGEEGFETFCIGDCDIADEYVKEMPELAEAQQLLNAFFMDWDE
jgi:hypothetical protein